MSMTHWKKLTNPDYLGAYAFEPGEVKIVTIQSVTRESITGAEGRKSDETVLHFVQDVKPLILNNTNATVIQKVLGTPYIEEWPGKNIALVVRQVKAFGETVDAVRVKLEKIGDICAVCGNRIDAAGDMSAQKVAEYTRHKFGKPLCSTCAKNVKSAGARALT